MLATPRGNLPECSWDSPLIEADAVDADGLLQYCLQVSNRFSLPPWLTLGSFVGPGELPGFLLSTQGESTCLSLPMLTHMQDATRG
jgi:hypothetical protein